VMSVKVMGTLETLVKVTDNSFSVPGETWP
jgi:hypothetical protein